MAQAGVGIVGNARKKNDHWFAQCVGSIYDDVEGRIVDAPLSRLDPVPDASAAGIRRLGPAPRDSWILREFGEIVHHTGLRTGAAGNNLPCAQHIHSLEGGMAGTSQDEIFLARQETCSVNIFSEGKRQVSSAGFSVHAESRLPRARRRRWPSRRGSAKCGRL